MNNTAGAQSENHWQKVAAFKGKTVEVWGGAFLEQDAIRGQ